MSSDDVHPDMTNDLGLDDRDTDLLVSGTAPTGRGDLAALGHAIGELRHQTDRCGVPVSPELEAVLDRRAAALPAGAVVVELGAGPPDRSRRHRIGAAVAAVAAAVILVAVGLIAATRPGDGDPRPLALAASSTDEPATVARPESSEPPPPATDAPEVAPDHEGFVAAIEGHLGCVAGVLGDLDRAEPRCGPPPDPADFGLDDGWSFDLTIPPPGFLGDRLDEVLEQIAPWLECVSAGIEVGARALDPADDGSNCVPPSLPDLAPELFAEGGPCTYETTDDGAILACRYEGSADGSPFAGELEIAIESWLAGPLLAEVLPQLTTGFDDLWPELESELGDLRAELDEVWPELESELGDLRAELDEVWPELESELGDLRAELDEVWPELESELGDLRAELDEVWPELESELGELFSGFGGD